MPMPTTNQRHRGKSEGPDLFHRPTDHPTWDRLPEPCRQEARRLITQMFLAQHAAGESVATDKEADHE
jgi:hypothetical protein